MDSEKKLVQIKINSGDQGYKLLLKNFGIKYILSLSDLELEYKYYLYSRPWNSQHNWTCEKNDFCKSNPTALRDCSCEAEMY